MPRRRVPKRRQALKVKASRARRQNPLWTSNRSQRDGCPSRKMRYRSEEEAKAGLAGVKDIASRGNVKRRESRYYWCPLCNGYHLSSAPEIAPPLGPVQ